jgi:hypothetical protein
MKVFKIIRKAMRFFFKVNRMEALQVYESLDTSTDPNCSYHPFNIHNPNNLDRLSTDPAHSSLCCNIHHSKTDPEN